MSKESLNDNVYYGEGSSKKKGFFKSVRTDKIYRRKCLVTLCCGVAYGMYGWHGTQTATALPELQRILDVELDTISWIYTTICIGTIFSGFTFGFIYDRFNRFTVMAICLIGGGILHAIVPLSTSFPGTLVLRLVIGLFVGGIETGMVTIVSTIWGTEESSFIHASYLSFYIGGFIGPLITSPFMANEFQAIRNDIEEKPNKANLTQSNMINASNTTKNMSIIPSSLTHVSDDGSRIFIAFIITGVATVIASLPFIYMAKSNKYRNVKLITELLIK